VTVCLITTDPADLPVFRVAVDPSPDNGLRATSRLGQCLGRLADDDLLRLNRSLLMFLGLAR